MASNSSVSLFNKKGGKFSSKFDAVIKSIKSRRLWECVFLGQVISLLICGTGVTSQILASDYKIEIPTAQNFVNYLLLAVVFNAIRHYRQRSRPNPLKFWTVLRERGFKYLILALVDVQANYLIVKAYQYTTLTSIQLLDCLVIPVVLILSTLFLRVRYGASHLTGVLICVSGVGFLIYSDVHQRRGANPGLGSVPPPSKLLGDILCLVAACLYGVSNVAQEYFVRTFDRFEFLAMLGFFGTIINGIQFMILEREEIRFFFHMPHHATLLVLLFSLLMFCLYYFMTVAIKATSATAVNLSILSADFYTLFFGIFLFKYQFNGLFLLAFALIINGVVVYSLSPTVSGPPLGPGRAHLEGSGNVESPRLGNGQLTTAITASGYKKMADEPLTEVELGRSEAPGTDHPLAVPAVSTPHVPDDVIDDGRPPHLLV